MESHDHPRGCAVNNAIYSQLGDRWYDADDDPVALLRAESRLRNPWVQRTLGQIDSSPQRILDVGCGAGFLSNYLAGQGHDVTGLDASQEALDVARRHDATGRVRYQEGDALSLPFADGSFDVVCAMDFLEHIDDPRRAISEAGRVLQAGGTFFFHTFNRNALAWLIIIKGVEWFVKNTPRHMHVLHLFLKPAEVDQMCREEGFEAPQFIGTRPLLGGAFWRMLASRVVPRDFEFTFTSSTLLAYSGYARRRSEASPLHLGAIRSAL